MKQATLALNLSTKKTRKQVFLEQMDKVVPWADLVGYRGLKKNTAQLITLFALSNLWMVRGKLMQTQA